MKVTNRTRQRIRPLLTSCARSLLLLVVVSLAACSLEDPADESGVVGTGFIFRGTVSEKIQLAASEIQIRAQSGERDSARIGSDGQYSVEDAPGVGPWLIRSNLGNGNYHYGIAYPEAIAHIHSYTDVIVRSWFLARYDISGSDIDTTFDAADRLPALPTADQFAALAGQYLALVEFVLADYGLTGSQLLSETFRADDTGIDLFLDRNPVLVDEDGGRLITVVITDPDGNTQTSTKADILLGVVDGQSDTQLPTMPTRLRVLSGESGEPVLVWDPSTDNTVVIGYDVRRDGELIATTPYPVYTDAGASAATFHLYEVLAIDIAGNRSTAADVSTGGIIDVGTLSAPVNVNALVSSTQRVELTWTQERIDVVAGFNVYRGATADTLPASPLIRVTSDNVTDATISPGQEYWYAVTSVDARGVESARSEPLRVLTNGIEILPPEPSPTTVPPLAGLKVPDTDAMNCTTAFPTYNIDTELTPAPGCYRVEGDIVVDNFGVLKLQPGVVLKFAAGSKLLIESRGRLMSEGTDENPVVLTGQQSKRAFWWGVEFDRSDDRQNIISRTVIEYHGLNSNDSAGISLVSSKNAPARLRVENSLIRYGGWFGISVPGLDAKLDSFKGNLITDNGRAAATNYTSLKAFTVDNSFTENGINRLFVIGGSYDENVIINDIGIPLQMGDVNQLRGTITVNAGVEMYFLEDQGFTIRGNLAILGTAAEPVFLNSIIESPGTWRGLSLVEGANAQISNVIIDNGGMIGKGRNPEGSNLFADDARMSLDNVTLRWSSSYGYHEEGSKVIIDKAENINIVDNARQDVVKIAVRRGQ